MKPARLLFTFVLFFFIRNGFAQSPDITRTYERDRSSGHCNIQITLKANGVGGMARYTEFIPENATVEVTQAGKAQIRKEKGKLKFIWTEFPEAKDIELSYKLIGYPEPVPDYEGLFDYLDEEGLKAAASLKKENIRERQSRMRVEK